jgi:pyruvate, water dikinase
MLSSAYDLSFYEFDEENDPKNYDVLLCDLVHGKPPLKPLYIGIGWYWYYHGFRNGAETLYLPTTRGWDSRFVNGYPYITAIRTSEQEIKDREPVFREKIKPFIEDFDGVWGPLKADLISMYAEAKEKRGLKKWDDIKKLSNNELLSFFLDFTYIINRKEGETHMIMLMASFYIAGLFQKMYREIFGVESAIDADFNKIMTGFESRDIWMVRELWRLGRQAVELGLEESFTSESEENLLAALDKSDAGRKWNQAYMEFLTEHGWRCERMHAYDTPAWIEKPELVLGRIKMLMKSEVFPADQKREKVLNERKLAEARVLEKVSAPQRPAFEILMKAAQKSGYWSEDHTYYCDFYIGSMGRWIVTEFGRRFAEAGCIDDAEDIHFLSPNEIRKAAIPMERINLRPYVEKRKNEFEQNLASEPAPFYGNIEKAQDVLLSDPTLQVSTQVPIVREELKADLYGAAAAPGTIEGVARVIMGADQLPELKEGEILVAPGTSAAWTVAFNLISGLITDGGGSLSHPVIMAREFGIPCVAGCLEGTQKIKTGQRVKIDGNLGVVYIKD